MSRKSRPTPAQEQQRLNVCLSHLRVAQSNADPVTRARSEKELERFTDIPEAAAFLRGESVSLPKNNQPVSGRLSGLSVKPEPVISVQEKEVVPQTADNYVNRLLMLCSQTTSLEYRERAVKSLRSLVDLPISSLSAETMNAVAKFLKDLENENV